MGSATSLPLVKKLKRKSEKDGCIGIVSDCLKRDKYSAGGSTNDEDELDGITHRDKVSNFIRCDLEMHNQIDLLISLFKMSYRYQDSPEVYVDNIFGIAKKLQKNGYVIDDKWLARIMLLNLPKEFKPMAEEIRRKNQLKSKVVAKKIIEVGNEKLYCKKCKSYSMELECWCNKIPQMYAAFHRNFIQNQQKQIVNTTS